MIGWKKSASIQPRTNPNETLLWNLPGLHFRPAFSPSPSRFVRRFAGRTVDRSTCAWPLQIEPKSPRIITSRKSKRCFFDAADCCVKKHFLKRRRGVWVPNFVLKTHVWPEFYIFNAFLHYGSMHHCFQCWSNLMKEFSAENANLQRSYFRKSVY